MNKDKTLNESKNNQTARDKLTITLITILTNRLKTQFAYFYSSLNNIELLLWLFYKNIIPPCTMDLFSQVKVRNFIS